MHPLTLGLLEFGHAPAQTNQLEAIDNVFNYAIKADELGFSRFWLAEHYITGLPWFSPEALLPVLGGMTSRLKIGIAGILLAVHSPYRVAASFKMLAHLFPDRIDLGIAKGIPPKMYSKELLEIPDVRDASELQCLIKPKLQQIIDFYQNEDAYFDKDIILPPFKGAPPDVWTLSNSFDNMQDVIDLQLNFTRSIFHTESKDSVAAQKEKLDIFRDAYYARHGRHPQVTIAFQGACHHTAPAARALAAATGVNVDYHEAKLNAIIGCPNYFQERLRALQDAYEINEFIFFNMVRCPDAKLLSLELLADKLGLAGAAVRVAEASHG